MGEDIIFTSGGVSTSELSFETAVDRLVKTLKLSAEFKEAIILSLDSFSQKKTLLEYVQSTPISFKTLPNSIEEAIVQYSRTTQILAEEDFYCRLTGETAETISIVPTTMLEEKELSATSFEALPFEFRKATALYIQVNSDVSIEERKKGVSWDTFFKDLRSLLEFLGSSSQGEFAAIDECRLMEDGNQLARLTGYLRLYGWNPFLILSGDVFLKNQKVLDRLKRISPGNSLFLQLKLDYLHFEQIGIPVFCNILKELKDSTAFLGITYVFDSIQESRNLFEQLLADLNFNDVNPFIDTKTRGQAEGEKTLYDFYPRRYMQPPLKLLINFRGTLSLLKQDDSKMTELNFSDCRWKKKLMEAYRLCGDF